jgi:thiol-disulfide isomerase/thioredoxin
MLRALLIAALLLLPLGSAQAQPVFPATKIHTQLASQKGWLNTSRALTAEDMRGRILLLDFWTYCCINCIHIMPDLAYLEQKFGDKLTVIGVHSAKFKNEQDSENIRQAILRYGIHHPVVNDYNFSLWEKFEVGAWPTLILVNPEGKIEKTYAGEGHRDALEMKES